MDTKMTDEIKEETAETEPEKTEETAEAAKEAEETTADQADAEAGSGEEGSEETAEASTETSKEEEDLNTKYLRLMADFQNFKKRSEKERSEIHARANEKIVTELLEVTDNFERALEVDADEGFKEGMKLILNQLRDVLGRAGVEEIEAEAAEFDPNFHNAVMMEDTDKVESGKVSEVLQKGYTLNGRVIRPAMVKVAN